MQAIPLTRVLELYGQPTEKLRSNWAHVVRDQQCSFLGRKCFKVRKSDPAISIGTCSVDYGQQAQLIVICPARFLERKQIFLDCLHLLTTHEPGNELHLVPEVAIPGGSVDYFLVSSREGRVKDFVGVELQAVDTTGTIWPARQRALRKVGVTPKDEAEAWSRPFGINWKMTAKTTLVQLHHKIQTFEHVHKRLVLVLQDRLLQYMSREFSFSHLRTPGVLGDSMHFHSYSLGRSPEDSYRLALEKRLSTDADGIGRCLGLQAQAQVELAQLMTTLETRISPATLFSPFSAA